MSARLFRDAFSVFSPGGMLYIRKVIVRHDPLRVARFPFRLAISFREPDASASSISPPKDFCPPITGEPKGVRQSSESQALSFRFLLPDNGETERGAKTIEGLGEAP